MWGWSAGSVNRGTSEQRWGTHSHREEAVARIPHWKAYIMSHRVSHSVPCLFLLPPSSTFLPHFVHLFVSLPTTISCSLFVSSLLWCCTTNSASTRRFWATQGRQLCSKKASVLGCSCGACKEVCWHCIMMLSSMVCDIVWHRTACHMTWYRAVSHDIMWYRTACHMTSCDAEQHVAWHHVSFPMQRLIQSNSISPRVITQESIWTNFSAD